MTRKVVDVRLKLQEILFQNFHLDGSVVEFSTCIGRSQTKDLRSIKPLVRDIIYQMLLVVSQRSYDGAF